MRTHRRNYRPYDVEAEGHRDGFTLTFLVEGPPGHDSGDKFSVALRFDTFCLPILLEQAVKLGNERMADVKRLLSNMSTEAAKIDP